MDQSVDDTDSDDSSEEDSLDDLNTEADSTTGDDFESILEELGDLDTEGDLATDEDSESVEDLEDTNIDLEDLELDEVSLFFQLHSNYTYIFFACIIFTLASPDPRPKFMNKKLKIKIFLG